MLQHSILRRLRELIADRRGAIPTEYAIVLAFSLVLMTAVAGLSVALVRSELRAQAVLRSNSP
jgi:Flp pilus assembly pilin Flp